MLSRVRQAVAVVRVDGIDSDWEALMDAWQRWQQAVGDGRKWQQMAEGSKRWQGIAGGKEMARGYRE